MNTCIISIFLLFVNFQQVNSDSSSLSEFYPKLRDEYIKPYMKVSGGNYFPWKLLELIPPNGRFTRPNFPPTNTYKKIDPMLFRVGIGKRTYGAIDPYLFRIGLGKRKRFEAEEQMGKTKIRRQDVEWLRRNGYRAERKRRGFLSSQNAANLSPENENSFSGLKL